MFLYHNDSLTYFHLCIILLTFLSVEIFSVLEALFLLIYKIYKKMCQITHYSWCIKASNSRRPPPPDRFVKCETHHYLKREGTTSSLRDLRRHIQCT